MVNITKTKIDNKGRIQLPLTFIKANNLNNGQLIMVKPMQGKNNSVAITWEAE